MKENSASKVNRSADQMIGKLEEIFNDKLKKYPTYSGAIVSSLNPDNTVNVYIPPNNTTVFTRISNQTSFPLAIGDSVELLLKDGSYSNCWVVAKHGVSFNKTITDDENQELNPLGKKVIGTGTGGSGSGMLDEDNVDYNMLEEYYLKKEDAKNTYVSQNSLVSTVTNIANGLIKDALKGYALKTDLEGFITQADLIKILQDYVTNTNLNNILSKYPTSDVVDEKLQNYITLEQLNTILQDYVRKDEQSVIQPSNEL